MMHKMMGQRIAVRMVLGVLLLLGVQASAVFAQDGLLSMSTLVEDELAYRSGQVSFVLPIWRPLRINCVWPVRAVHAL